MLSQWESVAHTFFFFFYHPREIETVRRRRGCMLRAIICYALPLQNRFLDWEHLRDVKSCFVRCCWKRESWPPLLPHIACHCDSINVWWKISLSNRGFVGQQISLFKHLMVQFNFTAQRALSYGVGFHGFSFRRRSTLLNKPCDCHSLSLRAISLEWIAMHTIVAVVFRDPATHEGANALCVCVIHSTGGIEDWGLTTWETRIESLAHFLGKGVSRICV